METNEIMTNEEVVETTEEIVKTSSGSCLKKVAGIGLAVVAGVIAYKYIAKPMIAKVKAKKDAVLVDDEDINDDFEDDDVETEEESK